MSFLSCITNGSDNLPESFADTSTLSIQFDNLGVVTVSFVFVHKSDLGSIQGQTSFSINGRTFTGTINGIVESELQGTDYNESRISFIGIAC